MNNSLLVLHTGSLVWKREKEAMTTPKKYIMERRRIIHHQSPSPLPHLDLCITMVIRRCEVHIDRKGTQEGQEGKKCFCMGKAGIHKKYNNMKKTINNLTKT